MFDEISFEKFGKQEVGIVGDVVYCRWHGSLEPEEMAAWAAWLRGHLAGVARVYQLMDMTDMQAIPAGTRKLLVEVTKEIPFAGFACVNASFAMQVVTGLVIKAMAIFTKRQFVVTFVKTRAEADQWLAEQRRAS